MAGVGVFIAACDSICTVHGRTVVVYIVCCQQLGDGNFLKVSMQLRAAETEVPFLISILLNF